MTVHIELLNFSGNVNQFPVNEIFFISHTHNKTKHTMKENHYKTNSKENPA